jgi:predicted transcriptional regulator
MSSFPYFRAIKFCDLHAKEHGKHMLVETAVIDNMVHHKITEADIEKVATYLLKGNVSTADEIAKILKMRRAAVAISLGVEYHNYCH